MAVDGVRKKTIGLVLEILKENKSMSWGPSDKGFENM